MADKVTLKCAKCGSSKFEVTTNPKPDDIITCIGCGNIGKYGDTIAEAESQVVKLTEDMLRDAGLK